MIENFVQQILSWIVKNKYKIATLVIAFIFFRICTLLPYINLLFRDTYYSFAFILILGILIFDIKSYVYLTISSLLFIGVGFLWIIEQAEIAETITEYTFAIILGVVLREMIYLTKK